MFQLQHLLDQNLPHLQGKMVRTRTMEGNIMREVHGEVWKFFFSRYCYWHKSLEINITHCLFEFMPLNNYCYY